MTKDKISRIANEILGTSLITDVIKKAEGKNKIYRCWRCNCVLYKNDICCPNCGATQNWEGVK